MKTLKAYLEKIKNKAWHYHAKAQNPFYERSEMHNPFVGAFSQTYVWVENEETEEKDKLT